MKKPPKAAIKTASTHAPCKVRVDEEDMLDPKVVTCETADAAQAMHVDELCRGKKSVTDHVLVVTVMWCDGVQ